MLNSNKKFNNLEFNTDSNDSDDRSLGYYEALRKNKKKKCSSGGKRTCGDICIPRGFKCSPGNYERFRPDSNEDSYESSSLSVLNSYNTRLDRSKPVCKKGKICGDICIPKKNKCSLEEGKKPVKAVTYAKYEVNPDTGEEYTIRDLKDIAKSKGVSNYSYMTKDQLKDTLKEVDKADKDPEQAERLAKTLTRDRTVAGRIARRLPKGNKGSQAFKRTFKAVATGERLLKDIGSLNPGWQAAAITSLAGGFALSQYGKMQGEYRKKFKDSAKNAQGRAIGIDVPYIKKDNIAFVVGGMPNQGHSAAKMTELLQKDDKLNSANHFVTFEHKEFDIKEGSVSTDKNAQNNNKYLIDSLTQEAQQHLKNIKRGQNEDAIRLASEIYAHYYKVDKNNNYANINKTINLISGGAGNHTVDEALEILSRMQPPEAKVPINQLMKQINVVSLGGVHYGTTDPKTLVENYRTITSDQDPYNHLPHINSQWVSSVKSHHPESYLEDPEVVQEIKRSWGMNRSSPIAQERTSKKKQNPKPANPNRSRPQPNKTPAGKRKSTVSGKPKPVPKPKENKTDSSIELTNYTSGMLSAVLNKKVKGG